MGNVSGARLFLDEIIICFAVALLACQEPAGQLCTETNLDKNVLRNGAQNDPQKSLLPGKTWSGKKCAGQFLR